MHRDSSITHVRRRKLYLINLIEFILNMIDIYNMKRAQGIKHNESDFA